MIWTTTHSCTLTFTECSLPLDFKLLGCHGILYDRNMESQNSYFFLKEKTIKKDEKHCREEMCYLYKQPDTV